jgi:MFS family permease
VVDGYSPLESGVALLPITVVMLALSARSGRLATAIGPRLQMSVGPVVVGGALVLMSRAPDGGPYFTAVLPAVLVLAFGLAVTVAPLTSTALNSVPSGHAGLASAVNNDVARLGSLIAVAVLPALGGITGLSYLHPDELAHGFRRAVVIAGSWCVAGGVAAAVGIRNPPHRAGPAAKASAAGMTHCALEATPLREAG